MDWDKKSKPAKALLVVGFNARPIVMSARKAGFRVFAVDYWGDLDLAESADDIETILKQRPGERPRAELSRPVAELLVEATEKMSSRHNGEVDSILIGSGLDDRPDLWTRLGRLAPVIGNTPEIVARVRDRLELCKMASRLGIAFPVTRRASDVNDALEEAKNIGYPAILKPQGGGGGIGIKLVRDSAELRHTYENEMVPRSGNIVFVQEYVRGKDVSASIMADGSKSVVVTVNRQLIGWRELGARGDFAWCGNVVPLDRSFGDSTVRKVALAAKTLADEAKLVGSNGFDFVVRASDGVPVLIECNPRFQGTLECVEMATGLDVVREHLRACSGDMRNRFPRPKQYVTKMIVFAKKKCVAGVLRGIEGAGDISPNGVVLDEGDPICTIHRKGRTKDESIQNARSSVALVYDRCH